MIESKEQAAKVLGLMGPITEEEVKKAYKKQVKEIHPDNGDSSRMEDYYMMVEAYDFLMNMLKLEGQPRVFGGTSSFYAKKKEQAQFEKSYQESRRRKAMEFDQRMQQLRQEKERETKEYDKAMKAIDAILVAEAIKTLVNAEKARNEITD